MSNEIGIHHRGGIATVSPRGRLVLGKTSETLRLALLDQYEQGHHRLLVDLSEVDYLDSAGIGELVSVFASVTRRGGAIALIHPAQSVRDSLRITRMDQLFPIYDDETAATQGLQSASVRNRGALEEFLGS